MNLKHWSLYDDPEESESNEIRQLREAREIAFENIQDKAHQTIEIFKTKRVMHEIDEGQYVMMYNAPLSQHKKALWQPWKGPYVVLKKYDFNVYKIALLENPDEHKKVNIDKLRLCFPKIEETIEIPMKIIESSKETGRPSKKSTE